MSKFRVTLTNVKCKMEPDVNTPEFSPKQIIALYLKFKPEAFCKRSMLVSTINYPWIIVFHIRPLMNFVTLSVINGMIRILQSKKDSDLQLRDFSFSMLSLTRTR